jgi:hypothetical protein
MLYQYRQVKDGINADWLQGDLKSSILANHETFRSGFEIIALNHLIGREPLGVFLCFFVK